MSTTRARQPQVPSVIRETSSPSVSVFWLDIQQVRRRLRDAARQLGIAHPEIEEVWLFGSVARGEAVPGSDADLLVVLESSELAFPERSGRYQPEFCGIGTDVLAYTRAELVCMRAEGNPFLQEIESERRLLWKRTSGDSPT